MKELPYFKYFPDEWINGDVTLLPFDLQGIFINVCGYYWKRNCSIAITKLKLRYSTVIEKQWQTLIDSGVMKIDSKNNVIIAFLDEQWNDLQSERDQKVYAGKLGAEKRWGKNSSAIAPPMAKHGNKNKEEDKYKEWIIDAPEIYKNFVLWLHEENPTGEPLQNVLALSGQISPKSFKNLMAKYPKDKIKDTILSMESKDLSEYNIKSFVLALNTWLRRG